MIVLGIDPGYGRVGWGVIDSRPELRCLNYGCIDTPKELSLVERYEMIRLNIHNLIEKYDPDAVGIEQYFFPKGKGNTTAIKVCQARGVILLTLYHAGISNVIEPTPSQVKAQIGYGQAEKKQVQENIKLMLNMAKRPRPDDAADALAVAIYAEGMARREALVNG